MTGSFIENSKNLKRIDQVFGNGQIQEIPKVNKVRENDNGEDSDGFEHIVFDIEEVECRMTDIEERDRTDEIANNRSVRGSIMNSPKEQ